MIAVETDQREAIVPLVVAGAGASVLPRPQAEAAALFGATTVPLSPRLVRSIGLIWRDGPVSPAAPRFIEAGAPVSLVLGLRFGLVRDDQLPRVAQRDPEEQQHRDGEQQVTVATGALDGAHHAADDDHDQTGVVHPGADQVQGAAPATPAT